MRVKIIKWLIRVLLTGYHLSHNPTKKKILHHPSGEIPALGEADS